MAFRCARCPAIQESSGLHRQGDKSGRQKQLEKIYTGLIRFDYPTYSLSYVRRVITLMTCNGIQFTMEADNSKY